MPAKTLVEVLEGAKFPCDRAQLLDYARRHHIPNGTLEVLAAIPERRYRDVGEVFTALPELREEDSGQEEAEGKGEQGTPLPWAVDWWLQGWHQSAMPLEVASYCLRRSVEVWPQWMRLAQRLWFPWAK